MFAKGSGPVIAVPAAAALASAALLLVNIPAGTVLVVIFLVLTALTVNFFRDPERDIGEGVVAPADGVLNRSELSSGGAYFSIFMNIHNVHVNRAPWAGRVMEVAHISGKHRPAYDRAADHNERVRINIEGTLGIMTVTQMVGIVARRIVPYVKAGSRLEKGERIGMIRFGSRVDLFVPSTELDLVARKGDRVLAGTTTLAIVRTGGQGARGEENAVQARARDGGHKEAGDL